MDMDWLRENIGARRRSLRSLFSNLGEQRVAGDTWLADMPFNVRCHNCLRQAGIRTLGELNDFSVDMLLERPAFGWGTLEKLLTVYAQTFQTNFAPDGASLFEETHLSREEYTQTFSELTGARRLTAAAWERPLSSLPLSNRVQRTLEGMEVRTIGDLLIRTSGELARGVCGRWELVAEIRERLTRAVDQWVLADTLRAALMSQPLRYQALEAAAAALDLPPDEVRARLLAVPGVVLVADWAHWVDGCTETLLPQWEFGSYGDLLGTVLTQFLSPRQNEILADYYGLFSEPLSRKELAEKQGVVPQRIYQILSKSEQLLRSRPALLSLVWLPLRELLREAKGVLTVAALERGLVTRYGCAPNEVRGAGLLALLRDYAGSDSGMTAVAAQMVLASPVTVEMVEAVIAEIHRQLMEAPAGVPETGVQGMFAEHWARLMPGRPVPDVAVSELAWLHLKIVVESGVWAVRRRGHKRQATDRLTQYGRMEAILSEQGQPMPVQDLFDVCRERYGEINVPACRTALKKNDHVFRAYERGVYGLVGWRGYSPSEIEAIRLQSRRDTPRTLRDKIETILNENGLPMHVQDLVRALQDRYEEGEERGVRSALLIRPERFQSHGNGVYGLTTWGEDAVAVLEEAAIDFLEQRGYPASETEICDSLRDQFPISVPVCRWALRQAWGRSGSVVPLEGGLWDVADEEAVEAGAVGVSVDDLLLEQLLSC